ncbi:unnamed protein product [Vitrella brassicaformis CCMP3155]|uniref:Uncharacterized protein n=1 Tax=Vitrella brassicaformis (strain CCMP3155) TaxID=1169540 RepID=A0A0G4ENM9_VITBC|nr:unnamed protein product [Vitrella brassicaformis CCMP3155]|eukprot:CEL99464.1 unnamed protein product [Vitrella brassicaformis CCMP3155]
MEQSGDSELSTRVSALLAFCDDQGVAYDDLLTTLCQQGRARRAARQAAEAPLKRLIEVGGDVIEVTVATFSRFAFFDNLFSSTWKEGREHVISIASPPGYVGTPTSQLLRFIEAPVTPLGEMPPSILIDFIRLSSYFGMEDVVNEIIKAMCVAVVERPATLLSTSNFRAGHLDFHFLLLMLWTCLEAAPQNGLHLAAHWARDLTLQQLTSQSQLMKLIKDLSERLPLPILLDIVKSSSMQPALSFCLGPVICRLFAAATDELRQLSTNLDQLARAKESGSQMGGKASATPPVWRSQHDPPMFVREIVGKLERIEAANQQFPAFLSSAPSPSRMQPTYNRVSSLPLSPQSATVSGLTTGGLTAGIVPYDRDEMEVFQPFLGGGRGTTRRSGARGSSASRCPSSSHSSSASVVGEPSRSPRSDLRNSVVAEFGWP